MGSDEGGLSFGDANAGRDIHVNFFKGATNQGPASFGGWRGDDPASPTTRSGRVDAAELAALRSGYVERPIDAALQAALEADHLVLLNGQQGWGRRWGALRSLAAVAEDRVHVLDAPRLKAVHDADYAEGEGYFYDASAIPWSDEEWTDARIGVLRARVATAGAYLVVLLPRGAHRPDLPCRLDWTRIGDGALLAGAGLDPPLPDGEAVVARLVGADAPVSEVARLIAHLRRSQQEGVSFEEAIRSHPGSRRTEIRERVDAIVDRETAAMVVCLCFLGGTSETAFDTGHLDLLDALSADDDDDERKRSREDRYGPRVGLLARCGGQQTCALRTVGDLQVDVPVIDFQVPALAPLYVEEFWRGRPNRFRREIVLWLRRFVPRLVGKDLIAAASRVVLLAEADFILLATELLLPWADGGDLEAHLAAGVLEILGDQGRSAEALLIASEWALAPLGTSRMLAATYFFAAVAVDHPQNALMVLGRKSMGAARHGPTRRTAEVGWRSLATAAAGDEALATTVTSYLTRHEAVRKGTLDDPVFAMLDIWFAGDHKTKPLALRTAALGPSSEQAVAEVLSSVAANTREHLHWYRPLVGYLGAGPATSAVAERLIDESLRRLAPGRRRYVVEVLLSRIWRWHREEHGPDRPTTEKADTVIRRHDPRRSP